ncbi:MAG: IclR family transcriptional regulator [Lachnospiraceae bacterium]|nr:IclR family transcriptional regulator [Lachnospiraceae bacterium]
MSGHRTTERILDILQLIADDPGTRTFSDISTMLDIPKSTLSPIMHSLVSRGFVQMQNNQHLSIGLSSFLVGNCFLQHQDHMALIEDILKDVTEKCQETTHYAILSEGDTYYLKKADSPQAIRMVSSIGNKLPAYSTALGKALLSDRTLSDLNKLYPDGLKAITKNTITNMDVLYEQLQAIRSEGYAYESEESNEFIRCIAVPIRKGSQIAAAISISVPIFRYTRDREESFKQLLNEAKSKIEQILSAMEIGGRS